VRGAYDTCGSRRGGAGCAESLGGDGLFGGKGWNMFDGSEAGKGQGKGSGMGLGRM
jgi:hypothetical protein